MLFKPVIINNVMAIGDAFDRLAVDMSDTIAGITLPDSKMARDLTEMIRDREPDLLFHHFAQVYLFGALTGQRKGLKYDAELLYVGAMFHDIG